MKRKDTLAPSSLAPVVTLAPRLAVPILSPAVSVAHPRVDMSGRPPIRCFSSNS